MQFKVLENCPADVLLGWDAISSLNLVIDAGTKTIYRSSDPDAFWRIAEPEAPFPPLQLPILEFHPIRAFAARDFIVPARKGMAIEVLLETSSPYQAKAIFTALHKPHGCAGKKSRRDLSALDTLVDVAPDSRTTKVCVNNFSSTDLVIHKDSLWGFVSFDFDSIVDESPNPIVAVATATTSKLATIEERITTVVTEMDHITSNQKADALKLLLSFARSLFVTELDPTRAPPPGEFSIDTLTEVPTVDHDRRQSLAEQRYLADEMRLLEAADVCYRTKSAYRAPVVLARKKDGTLRMCIDYTKLNNITVRDLHPLPRPEDLFAELRSASFFTTLDLASGYWQVMVAPADRHKLAFSIRSLGTYTWKRMPFGLTNAPAYFQRMMIDALGEYINDFAMVYLDDIIIYSNTFAEHLQHINLVLSKLLEYNLQIKISKCKFFQHEVTYLGFNIGNGNMKMNPAAVSAVTDCKPPRNLKQLQTVLGKFNYYRHFISKYSEIAEPMVRLTHKDVKFVFDDRCLNAFNTLKDKITSQPVLALPDIRPDAPSFILHTDASGIGLGAVLSQLPSNEEFNINKVYNPIAYYSKKLKPEETRYTVTELELFAIVKAVEQFRHYLFAPFIVVTDHQALVFLLNPDTRNARVHRWTLKLLGLSFKAYYVKGKNNFVADALSRAPIVPEDYESCYVVNGRVTNELPPKTDHPHVSLAMLAQLADTTSDIRNEAARVKSIAEFNWTRLQDADPLCQAIRLFVANNLPQQHSLLPICKKLHQSTNLHSASKEGSPLPSVLKMIRKKNGMDILRIIVPTIARSRLIELAHNHPTEGGHFGVAKTLEKLLPYYWPHMENDVKSHIQSCLTCARNAPMPSQRIGELNPIITTHPWQVVGMDVAGPLGMKNGPDHFLLIIDLFTRWVETYPLVDTTSATIVKHLERFCFEKGIPETIITDQAPNLHSQEMYALYDTLGINKARSTAGHQQSDGAAERAIGTIKKILTNTLQGAAERWAQELPLATACYNATVHSATGISPFQAVFGREKRSLLTAIADTREGPATDPEAVLNALNTNALGLHNHIRDVHRRMMFCIRRAQTGYKDAFDKKHTPHEFKAGDYVWFYPYLDLSRLSAFMNKRTGPYLVHSVLDKGVIIISHPIHKDVIRSINANRLEPCVASPTEEELQSVISFPKPLKLRPTPAITLPEALQEGNLVPQRMAWDNFRMRLAEVATMLFIDMKSPDMIQKDRAEAVKIINAVELAIPPSLIQSYTHEFHNTPAAHLRAVLVNMVQNPAAHFPHAVFSPNPTYDGFKLS